VRKRGPHKAIGLYAHITWHTWRWVRCITKADAACVVTAVLEAAGRCRVRVHSQAILTDHVHLVISFAPDTTLSSFIRHAKSRSALLMNQRGPSGRIVRWCRGYYANTLSWNSVAAARNYVGTQLQHHPDRVPE
jgi:REP element-mobilizing transposase RayT